MILPSLAMMLEAVRRCVSRTGVVILATIASSIMTACYRPYPPSRPTGVPQSAAWAGGWDGGGWVTCSDDDRGEENVCTIYDEQGRTRGPAHYRLKDLKRAARAGELRYTYVTGRAIGLEGGLELIQVPRNEAVRK